VYAWFLYRARAPSPTAVVAAIARNAGHIARPNSGHVYWHDVVYVIRYDGDRLIVGHRDRYTEGKACFWDAYRGEADVLAEVHERRRRDLFGPGTAAPTTPYLALLNELYGRYAAVHDREAERALLREGEARLRSIEAPPGAADFVTARWRWTKRHTSPSSFPFIRPGIDVYKASGFDLHGDGAHPRWYAVARFKY
jgi:hypothetical protein